MKLQRTIALALAGIALSATVASAQPGDEAPAAPPKVSPTKVLATVGKAEIRVADVDALIARQYGLSPARMAAIPAEHLAGARKQALPRAIQKKLLDLQLATVPCSDEELAAYKRLLADRLLEQFISKQGLTDRELRDQAKIHPTSPKIAALIEGGPVAYFDGTKVKANHILISCKPYAPAAERAAARKTLLGVAKEIAAKKITFTDAARKHSTGPSAPAGGDLGEFDFANMVPPFAMKAFKMKVGQISGVVETDFGFHLIQVTGRTEGSGKPGPNAKEIATGILQSQQEARIVRESAAKHPVVEK